MRMSNLSGAIGISDVTELLQEIRDALRELPGEILRNLDERELIQDCTSLAEMQSAHQRNEASKVRYSFSVCNQPKPELRPFWITAVICLLSIPFWLAALYGLVRFIKWAWVG